MPKWNGGVIGAANNPSALSAKGVWSLAEVTKAVRAGIWPVPTGGGDPYFSYNTLLLPGQGTNGANNNTFLDSSTNNFTITRNGNVTQGTFTPFSHDAGYWSNYFDGNGDSLTYPNSAAIDFGMGDVTIEAWVYLLTSSGAQSITAAFATGGTGFTAWSFDLTASRFLNVTSYQYGTSQTITATNNAVPANQWTHVAYTRSGGVSRLFVNGVSCSFSGTLSQAIDSGGQTGSIGSGRYVGYEAFLNGYISNVRIVKGTAVYTSNFTPSTAPLTAISGTSLLTCQSNRFVDNSTNAFAITRNGDASVQTFQPFNTPTSTYSAATNGGSGYFDGSGDYLTAAANNGFNFGTGDFTVEGWIYPTRSGLNAIWTNGAASSGSFGVGINSTNKLQMDYYGGTSLAGATSVQLNAWNYFAFVRSGSNLYVYLNGVRDGSTTTSSNNSTNSFALGRFWTNDATNEWQGYMSDFRISDATALYTSSTMTVPTAPTSAIASTTTLLKFTNSGIIDNAISNDLETVGNAQISTSQYKWGTSSVYFNPGETNPVVIPNNPMFNLSSGDFTIESWVYVSSHRTFNTLISKGTSNAREWAINVGPSVVNFYWSTNGSSTGDSTVSASIAVPTATWVHVAVTRVGTTIKLFLNGNQIGSGTFTSMYSGTAPVYVGRFMDFTNISHDLSGYVSDLRITKGYARYLYNFPCPSAPFPLFFQAAAAPSADPYFKNTTLLLAGNGTNGAQNNTFLDSSTNAFSITRNGNTTQGTFSPFSKENGRWGNYFSGGTYLNVTNTAALNLAGSSFTIEAWVYCTGLSGIYASWIAGKRALSGPYPVSWYLGLNSSGQVFLADNSTSATSAEAVPLNQWSHVAAVCTGTSVQMYVNGVKSGAAVNLSISEVSTDLTIGNYPIDNPVFNGYISNLRLIKGQALTTGSFTPPTGPVSNAAVGWTGSNVAASITGTVSLLTCQSNRFVDNSGNNLTITVSGTPSVQTFSPFQTLAAYDASTNGGSVYLDGSGDYLAASNVAALQPGASTTPFCIECWINPTATPGVDTAVFGNFKVISYPGNCDGFDLLYSTGRTLASRWGYPNYNDSVASPALSLNTWNHFAVSRNSSGVMSFYLNGTRWDSKSSNTTVTTATAASFWVGWAGSLSGTTVNPFPGYISGFRFTKGSTPYDPTQSTLTLPTAPPTAIANTSLLLSGTNGGIIDNSMSNDLETIGGAQISTTQSKFGGASIYIPTPIGPQILTPAAQNVVLGAADFTIECWYYPVSKPDVAPCIIGNDTTGSFPTNYWALHDRHSGVSSTAFSFYCGNANGSTGFLVGTSTVSNNAWYHVAVTRFGNTWRLFVNGTVEATATSSASIDGGVAKRLSIGRSGYGDSGLNAYIDDLRITKGIARYVQNFTPPTQPLLLL